MERDVLPKAEPFVEKLGMVFEELSADRVVATMPVDGNTQPYGLLHGGATCSLVETLASTGAAIAAGLADNHVMGIHQSTSFIRAATSGIVRGTAIPVHRGRTTQVWDVDVTSVETGRLIASGRVTLAVRPRPTEGGEQA